MGKISNFTIFLISVGICVLIVSFKTIETINNKHDEKALYALHSKVEYYAKRCYLEEKCKDEISLSDLYNLKYIEEELVNPVTKEVIDYNTKINYKDNKIIIDWKN